MLTASPLPLEHSSPPNRRFIIRFRCTWVRTTLWFGWANDVVRVLLAGEWVVLKRGVKGRVSLLALSGVRYVGELEFELKDWFTDFGETLDFHLMNETRHNKA
ncbi:hypothetical protein V6N13_051573 [Hibiscus sabdariffa]|uniref:Uncharacterized protein n=1 Tax=Hibiscus sabdariffa TaxID=183260 RepID=A0ABR2T3T7_9ROSI